jgi:hypothetical protein
LRRWYDQLATTPREIQTDAQTQKVTRKVLGLSTSQLSHEVAAYAEGIAR